MRGSVLVLVALAACAADEAGDWDSVVEVGDVGSPSESPVQAPTSARVGADVLVVVTTEGGGCISKESTVIEGLDITPYDRRRIPPPNGGCTLLLQQFRHEAVVRFDAAGAQAVHIHVRRYGQPTEIIVYFDVQL